ncbi:MAG TPA: ABC-2 family transporter protein [Bacilli bacterium]
MLSAYLELIRIRFLMMLAYRVNYYSGIVIYAINIGAYYFLWQAIYGDKTSLGDMDFGQMATYLAVTWMARAFYFNNLDREISNEIRDGSVAVQFIRPYQYLVVKMMQGLGEGMFRLLMFSVPGMVIVSFLFPLKLPRDPHVWALFFLMILFSFLINSQINILTGLCTFYLENIEGLMRMKRVVVDLCSGLIIPLSFFPGWARHVLEWLPFQAISYLPGSEITGKISGAAAYQALGIQAVWFIGLTLPMIVIWRMAKSRLFVQGG